MGAAWHATFRDDDATHAGDIGMVLFAEPLTEVLVKIDTDPVHHASVIKSLMGNFAAVAMGWGTDERGVLQAKLQMAALMIAAPAGCNTLFGNISADAICVGDGVGKVQVCPGDSGGPLLWLNELDITADVLTASTQIGIVSWGGACQDNLPYSMFVDISSHGPWIHAASTRLGGDVVEHGCDNENVCFEHISISPVAPPSPPAPPAYPSFFSAQPPPVRGSPPPIAGFPPPPRGTTPGPTPGRSYTGGNTTTGASVAEAPLPVAIITIGVALAAAGATFVIMYCSNIIRV